MKYFYDKKAYKIAKPVFFNVLINIGGFWPQNQKKWMKKNWRKHYDLIILFKSPVQAMEHFKDVGQVLILKDVIQ